MLRRWTVAYGPEFPKSKVACGISPERLDEHLNAIALSLERDPFTFTTAFADDAHRVIETRDYFEEGFVLAAFVVLQEGFVAEIKWIETHPLPDEEPDE